MLAVAPSGLGQEKAPLAEAARAALAKGAYEEARTGFEQELTAARERGDRAAQTDLLFYLGLTEQQRAGGKDVEDAARRRLLQEAVRFYSQALEGKSLLKQPVGPTLNNLGRVYMDLGWDDTARDILKRAVEEAKDDPRWPVYAKSYARLLASSEGTRGSGDWRDSVAMYRKALEARPEDAEAREAVAALYLEHAPPELPGYLWWLAERGQVDSAQAEAIKALRAGRFSDSVAAQLLGVVAGTLARQYDSPGQFRESDAWKALGPLEADERIGPGIRELARLYSASDFDPQSYAWWRRQDSSPSRDGLSPGQAFRQCAILLGRWKEGGATPEDLQAAERYFLLANDFWEWAPDPVAFFELADLYIQTGRMEDLERLSQKSPQLFDGKVQAYRQGDLHAIFDFHQALGLVYGTLGNWGDRSKPASAIFQLEGARRAAEDYNRQRPAGAEPLMVSPQLVSLLAQGYEKTGQEEQARTTRVAAAAEYRRLGDEKSAEWVLKSGGPAVAPAPIPQQKDLGRVVKVRGEVVYLDLGSEAGLKPGDVLQVVRRSATLDPTTGTTLPDVVVSEIEVVSTRPDHSTGKLQAPSVKKVAAGDIVREKPPATPD